MTRQPLDTCTRIMIERLIAALGEERLIAAIRRVARERKEAA